MPAEAQPAAARGCRRGLAADGLSIRTNSGPGRAAGSCGGRGRRRAWWRLVKPGPLARRRWRGHPCCAGTLGQLPGQQQCLATSGTCQDRVTATGRSVTESRSSARREQVGSAADREHDASGVACGPPGRTGSPASRFLAHRCSALAPLPTADHSSGCAGLVALGHEATRPGLRATSTGRTVSALRTHQASTEAPTAWLATTISLSTPWVWNGSAQPQVCLACKGLRAGGASAASAKDIREQPAQPTALRERQAHSCAHVLQQLPAEALHAACGHHPAAGGGAGTGQGPLDDSRMRWQARMVGWVCACDSEGSC